MKAFTFYASAVILAAYIAFLIGLFVSTGAPIGSYAALPYLAAPGALLLIAARYNPFPLAGVALCLAQVAASAYGTYDFHHSLIVSSDGQAGLVFLFGPLAQFFFVIPVLVATTLIPMLPRKRR